MTQHSQTRFRESSYGCLSWRVKDILWVRVSISMRNYHSIFSFCFRIHAWKLWLWELFFFRLELEVQWTMPACQASSGAYDLCLPVRHHQSTFSSPCRRKSKTTYLPCTPRPAFFLWWSYYIMAWIMKWDWTLSLPLGFLYKQCLFRFQVTLSRKPLPVPWVGSSLTTCSALWAS